MGPRCTALALSPIRSHGIAWPARGRERLAHGHRGGSRRTGRPPSGCTLNIAQPSQNSTVKTFKRTFKLIVVLPPWWVVFHDDFFGPLTLGFWSKWGSITLHPPQVRQKAVNSAPGRVLGLAGPGASLSPGCDCVDWWALPSIHRPLSLGTCPLSLGTRRRELALIQHPAHWSSLLYWDSMPPDVCPESYSGSGN